MKSIIETAREVYLEDYKTFTEAVVTLYGSAGSMAKIELLNSREIQIVLDDEIINIQGLNATDQFIKIGKQLGFLKGDGPISKMSLTKDLDWDDFVAALEKAKMKVKISQKS
jgi:hypothetical protein